MSDLHRVIYLSASRQEMSLSRLDALLAVARRNNESAGVTGLLLFHDGSFFQVLEGPKDAVDRIFAAIEGDNRHSRVIILQRTACERRAFPDWSMGYVDAHALRPEQKANLIDLRSLVGREGPSTLSSSASVSGQINAFLGSFREFA